jgi:hypothetical protein
MVVFWTVAPCSLVEPSFHFRAVVANVSEYIQNNTFTINILKYTEIY